MAKIPAHANRVFKGILFDTYQWEQDMFDGTKATFEMVKRLNTVVVIPVMADGRICYSKQEQPGKPVFLGLFGGRADNENESSIDTAKRELLEEAGLVSDSWQEWMAVQPSSKTDWTVTYFIAKDCQQVAEPHLDPGERIEVKYASVEAFINDVVMDDNFKEYEIKQALCQTLTPTRVTSLKEALS